MYNQPPQQPQQPQQQPQIIYIIPQAHQPQYYTDPQRINAATMIQKNYRGNRTRKKLSQYQQQYQQQYQPQQQQQYQPQRPSQSQRQQPQQQSSSCFKTICMGCLACLLCNICTNIMGQHGGTMARGVSSGARGGVSGIASLGRHGISGIKSLGIPRMLGSGVGSLAGLIR